MRLAGGPVQSVGLNSDVVANGRRFHVQTNFQPDTGELTASVFEDGRLVERLVRRKATTLTLEELQAEVAGLHQEASERIQQLFLLHERLHKLGHAPSHNRLGLALLRRGFYEEARQQFEQAIALEQNEPDYHKNLGDVYLAQRRYSKAVECYRASLALGPHYADVHTALGRAYLELGRVEDALAHLRQAIVLNNKFGRAHLELALALLQKMIKRKEVPSPAKLDEVAGHLRQALRYHGGDSERLTEALHALQRGAFPQALEFMRLAGMGRTVDSPTVREQELLLRLITESSGEEVAAVDELVGELERLTAQHEGYADLHNSLGVAYLIQGRNLLLRAAAEFKKALRINPRFQTAKRNLRLVENDGRGLLILLRTLLK
ncbi:MAG: tetratricopeptide repeat protein [candidate division KSB1 bacterium]|nr:tetratricopeptide repeat protein [candidate division KSB1 bacterium]MDZ7295963.1 tetratricopeptide repeat protein [candidate division KSB1 bacterium]MDZ7385230.1 tetratricopeptide repeat protein [candidate division KSB1 bacterium]MDZ7392324.1 tetratricopeptide repeat protein [candidate division KSB1 bacterium]MDZ7412532.1 tetratricopeptide repeat protein [candidate division KSB1 bacterium]